MPDLGVLIMVETRTDAGMGGDRRHVLSLCAALKIVGARVLVLYNAQDDFFHFVKDQGIDIRYVPFPRKHPRTRLRVAERRRIKRHIRSVIQDANISVIHLMWAYLLDYVDRSWGLPIVCAQIGGFPDPRRLSVLTRRALLHPRELVQNWYRKHVLFNYGRADLVINVSECARKTAIRAFGVPEAKNVVIRQGVRPPSGREDPALLRRELGIPETDCIVLSVGRITRAKGVEEFGEVASRVSALNPVCHFVFAGYHRNAAYREQVVRRYGDRVLFLGGRDDMYDILAASDVLLQMTHREAAPSAIIEGMAFGLPTVAWDIPGVNELVDDGETGYLLPFGDIDAATAAVQRLLQDAGLYRRLSANARVKFGDFSLNRLASDLTATYASLLTGESQAPAPA